MLNGRGIPTPVSLIVTVRVRWRRYARKPPVSGPVRTVVLPFLERGGDAQKISLQEITASCDQHIPLASVLHSLGDYCFSRVVAEANQGLHDPSFRRIAVDTANDRDASVTNSGSSCENMLESACPAPTSSIAMRKPSADQGLVKRSRQAAEHADRPRPAAFR